MSSNSVEKVANFIAHINLKDASAIEGRLERVGFSRYLAKVPSAEDVDAANTGLHPPGTKGPKGPLKRRSIKFNKALTSFAPSAHDTVAGPTLPSETSIAHTHPPPPSAHASNLSFASPRSIAAESTAGREPATTTAAPGRAGSVAGSAAPSARTGAHSHRGGHVPPGAESSGFRGSATHKGPATSATTAVGPGGFKKRRTPPLVIEPSPELEARLREVFVAYAMHGSRPNSVYISFPKFFRLLLDSGALLVQSAEFGMVQDVFARVQRGRKVHPFGSDDGIAFWEFVDALQRLARLLNEMSAPIDAAVEVMDVVATTDPAFGAEREDVLTELVLSSQMITELRHCEPQLKILHTCYRGGGQGVREEAFLQLCTDFQVVPLLTSQQAAREAFAHAVKPGPMGLALCWVGLGEAIIRVGVTTNIAASTAPTQGRKTERPGSAATNKTSLSGGGGGGGGGSVGLAGGEGGFVRTITFDGPPTTVEGLAQAQRTAKSLFYATDEWGYRSVLSGTNGSSAALNATAAKGVAAEASGIGSGGPGAPTPPSDLAVTVTLRIAGEGEAGGGGVVIVLDPVPPPSAAVAVR